jgi:hypothetical protein
MSCSDDALRLHGRLLVGTIAAEDGTAVGLAVEFLRTSGDRDAIRNISLQAFVSGDRFFGSSGPSSAVCLSFSDSGRVSLVAEDGLLDTTSRVVLTAHYPPEPGSTNAPAEANADAGSVAAGVSCTGSVIDDAVWPTRGAQVIRVEENGGAGGSTAGAGGTGGGAAGAAGSGAGGSGGDGDAGPDSGDASNGNGG